MVNDFPLSAQDKALKRKLILKMNMLRWRAQRAGRFEIEQIRESHKLLMDEMRKLLERSNVRETVA